MNNEVTENLIENKQEPTKKSKKGLLIIVGIVLIVGVAFLAYWLFFRPKKSVNYNFSSIIEYNGEFAMVNYDNQYSISQVNQDGESSVIFNFTKDTENTQITSINTINNELYFLLFDTQSYKLKLCRVEDKENYVELINKDLSEGTMQNFCYLGDKIYFVGTKTSGTKTIYELESYTLDGAEETVAEISNDMYTMPSLKSDGTNLYYNENSTIIKYNPDEGDEKIATLPEITNLVNPSQLATEIVGLDENNLFVRNNYDVYSVNLENYETNKIFDHSNDPNNSYCIYANDQYLLTSQNYYINGEYPVKDKFTLFYYDYLNDTNRAILDYPVNPSDFGFTKVRDLSAPSAEVFGDLIFFQARFYNPDDMEEVDCTFETTPEESKGKLLHYFKYTDQTVFD